MVDARLEGCFESHLHLREVHDDQIVTATVSDLFGVTTLPSLDIWTPGIAALREVDAALAEADVLRAADALQRAAARVDEAYTRYDTYRNGTEGGASRAITLLEFTEAVGATAATVATGGLAGASLLPAAAVVGATAGAYGAVSAGAQQGSEVAHGLRNGFDVGAILRRGATDAVTGFVGALAGGMLTERLTRGFGGYLGNATDETLAELGQALGLSGPMPRDYLLTNGERVMIDFFSSVGSSPLTTAVSAFVERFSGDEETAPTASELVDQVLSDMVEGGLVSLFISFLTHHAVSGPRPAGRSAEASPAPRSSAEPDPPAT